mmetsp:Transcript_13526/g.24223  ORF Transcript_13526/g.24223 Transcript_13526/m.24223 type:complete len:317 (+) Transcript_13526:222-1172(+)
MGKKVFVTGGGGFVGRNLIKWLVGNGYVVVAMTRSEASGKTVQDLGATKVQGDLSDVDEIVAGMGGCEAVFHCAALASLQGPWEVFKRDNIDATRNVIQACRNAGVKRLIHCSTEAVLCGENSIVNATEESPYPKHPCGPYPESKMISEIDVLEANDPDRLETVVVRPRIVWGRDDTNILPLLSEQVKNGRFMFINHGDFLTSVCHIDNLIEGLIKAYLNGEPGNSYFVTDGKPIKFREFVIKTLATQGVDASNCWSFPASLGYLASWFGLMSRTYVRLWGEEVTLVDNKARNEIGYEGRVTFEQGLQSLSTLKVK